MNILKSSLLSLLLFTGPVLLAEPAAVLPSSATPDPLAEALPILQSKYVHFQALAYKPGDHLGDLIARSNGGISLTAPEAPSTPLSILTMTLPDGTIYWRLASFTPEKSWLDLANQLEQESASATGVILDLRSNSTPDDYHGAAQVLAFFAPQDSSLTKYDVFGPAYGVTIRPIHLPIVILTNSQTSGAAEALAAFLKTDGALVVGRATAGKAAIFQEQKLSSGQILRFAVENITQADGTPLLGHPITPDLSPVVNNKTERAALTLIRDHHLPEVIQESAERHRMSEAYLVQGQDPEWDDYLSSLEGRPVLLSLPVIHDVVLISALDSLKAIRFSQQPLPVQATATASLPASTSIQ